MSNLLEAVPPPTNGATPPARHGASTQSLAMEVLARLGVAVVLGWVAVAIGVVMVVVGYYLVSGTADIAEQLARFSSACVGGLTFIGVGGLLILSNHYRETTTVVEELRAEIAELRASAGQPGVAGAGPVATRPGTVVRVGNGSTYHDATCIFADGKPDAMAMSGDEARAQGLRPCQVCAPTA